ERLALMLEQAGGPVVLADERSLGKLPAGGGQRFCLDRDEELLAGLEPTAPPRLAGPENAAYLMFTSGSTGTPKGVVVPHRAAAWYAATAVGNYGLGSGDRVLQYASVSFDISVEEIFPALACGATLVLTTGEPLSAARLFEKCRREGVTALFMATALWHELTAEASAHPESFPASLRLVCFGGEKVLPERVSSWRRSVDPAVELINSYGPTEATVVAALYWIEADGEAAEVPLGRPIPGACLYGLDRHFIPLPIGVPGELLIGGAGVARGYLHRPDLTADRFVPDPLSGEPGGRLYRTGDRTRWRWDGNLEYLGRIDRQVKVRGFRVEPGEIESLLSSYPGVFEAVVLVCQEPSRERRLVAYVLPQPGGEVSVRDLRGFAKDRLPAYMVPATIVSVGSLPRTPNGKVDRLALERESPILDREPWEAEPGWIGPRTPTEELVAGVWSAVLGVERIGVADDFFDLGGHSLLATQVVSRLEQTLGIAVPLKQLFQTPTLAGLAESLDAGLAAGREAAPPIVAVPRDGALPLSFAQERLWFLDQLEPGSPLYNMPLTVGMPVDLQAAVLESALAEVVRRHEALRTTFRSVAGRPVQEIAPACGWSLPEVDLSALQSPLPEAQRLSAEEALRPFDLSGGPLLRTTLLRVEPRAPVLLLLTMHHIVSDGWSLEVLERELTALYEAFSRGAPSPLAELPVQYADFAVWQRQWLQGDQLDRQLAYWRRQLADLRGLDLPLDRPRPVAGS
ncbi:MAG TPA: amino acid adenylation domain-containing protein, partial [Thermoanaerobaculia bacterium]|nr:amino acid adenylation domain-containing protein [Thermoanaerobaculia bacterium]